MISAFVPRPVSRKVRFRIFNVAEFSIRFKKSEKFTLSSLTRLLFSENLVSLGTSLIGIQKVNLLWSLRSGVKI